MLVVGNLFSGSLECNRADSVGASTGYKARRSGMLKNVVSFSFSACWLEHTSSAGGAVVRGK